MSNQARSERKTQNRVASLFTQPENPNYLGYRYLGDWSKREKNSPIEVDILRDSLKNRGYSDAHISAALLKFQAAADAVGISLYEANLRTYQLLRYGVQVQISVGKSHETVHLIDWENPENNDFALAEEVTLRGGYQRRPDLVIYINGIAVVVIELKRATVDVGEGVRQIISNQLEEFNKQFFSTVQLVMAGSDSQGLRYGTTGTPENFFMEWKVKSDSAEPLTEGALLDRPLKQMLSKTNLLEFIRFFVIYDAGIKKVPRAHQYFGVKAAQKRITEKKKGGVIWHTQGSGKSILMVFLAKWLLEIDPYARILVITDRDELDKQIGDVMVNSGVIGKESPSPRIASRQEFLIKLAESSPRLLCALIHKFELDLSAPPPPIHGEFYVFVDECHRTQGGDMNKQMKRWLPDAIFIGFTGTPLFRADKKATFEVFGSNIHTYKFGEAVADKVVLDLKYEARSVPQRLTSEQAFNEWFNSKTKMLNDYSVSVLRKHWATMKGLMSSGERKQRIVADISHDFAIKPRLSGNSGTAILVAASIYDACHYFRLFQNSGFDKPCGIITSYEPNHNAISRESKGSDEHYKFDTYRDYVLKNYSSTTDYENKVKDLFVNKPVEMKLLIVVSKLLTGFDAPSCSYIYLDNSLRDHTLFQAICRTNRLDGEEKEFGHIVDYKEQLEMLRDAVRVYTDGMIEPDEDGDDNVIIKDWKKEGKVQLDAAREELHYLCAPVNPPRQMEQFLSYFCGDANDPEALLTSEPLRVSFYKSTAKFLRAYAALAQVLEEAGYSVADSKTIKQESEFYSDIRMAVKKHSGEELDIKPYEADMRRLINTYIQADPAKQIGGVSDMSLTELIAEEGIYDAITKRLNPKNNLTNKAIAEGVINNVRKTIVRDQLTDPKYYKEIASLFEDLIKQKRDETASFEKFLEKTEALVKNIANKGASASGPVELRDKSGATVIYNNLPDILPAYFPEKTLVADRPMNSVDPRLSLALEIDKTMREKAPSNWRGDYVREGHVLNALFPLMHHDRDATRKVFEIIKNQPGYK